jgi:hypothetical protein
VQLLSLAHHELSKLTQIEKCASGGLGDLRRDLKMGVQCFVVSIRSGVSLPTTSTTAGIGVRIVADTANTYSGLQYPIIIVAMSFVVGLTFLPETKDRAMARICLVKASMSTFPH